MLANKFIVMSALMLTLIVMAFVSPVAAAVVVGDKAPDFQLGSVDGKTTIKLSDYTTKPTLLIFWAGWCPHCRDMASVEQKIFSELGTKGVNVVGVSLDSSREAADSFVKSRSLTFPNAYGGTREGRETVEKYGIRGIPTFFIIDKDGVVKATYSGEVREETIRQEFAKLGVV